MAKKKSKSQKLKKSQQRIKKKILKEKGIVVETKSRQKTTATPKVNTSKKQNTTEPKKKVVKNDKVIYNVALTKPELLKDKNKTKKSSKTSKKSSNKELNLDKTLKLKKIKTKKESGFKGLLNDLESKIPKREVKIEKIKKTSKKKPVKKQSNKNKISLINKIKNLIKLIGSKIIAFFVIIKKGIVQFFTTIKSKFIKLFNKKDNSVKKIKNKKQTSKKKIKEESIELPKLKKNNNVIKPENKIQNFIKTIWNNRHVFYNSALILTFLLLLIGLIRVNVYSKGLIIYVSSLLIFLSLVAISHNKHVSGKIFTILLCLGMGFTIYILQYNYDFINNLNTIKYEYKTYYVVTFDNSLNKSIYNVSGKKIGILKDNEINVERKLNTKIDKVTYVEFDDLNKMYEEFYNQKFRAVIVTENQYKYLVNKEATGAKSVKILYEFEVNAKK